MAQDVLVTERPATEAEIRLILARAVEVGARAASLMSVVALARELATYSVTAAHAMHAVRRVLARRECLCLDHLLHALPGGYPDIDDAYALVSGVSRPETAPDAAVTAWRHAMQYSSEVERRRAFEARYTALVAERWIARQVYATMVPIEPERPRPTPERRDKPASLRDMMRDVAPEFAARYEEWLRLRRA